VPMYAKNSANPQWTTSKVDIFRSASPFLPIYIFYIFLWKLCYPLPPD
jgi:hypothetical protein